MQSNTNTIAGPIWDFDLDITHPLLPVSYHTHIQFPICMPRVPATAPSFDNLVETGDGVYFGQIPRLLQVVEHYVALGVYIGRGVMGDWPVVWLKRTRLS